MIPNAQPQSNRHIKFAVLFTALAGLYFLWLVACWPGVLGQDSLAIMLEDPHFGIYILYTSMAPGDW